MSRTALSTRGKRAKDSSTITLIDRRWTAETRYPPIGAAVGARGEPSAIGAELADLADLASRSRLRTAADADEKCYRSESCLTDHDLKEQHHRGGLTSCNASFGVDMSDATVGFGDVAQKLARNPLGIIALFIVLVYGFAALVTGSSGSFTPGERLPLIYSLMIIFPVLVLGVFGWLVSRHSNKLFAPSDFRNVR